MKNACMLLTLCFLSTILSARELVDKIVARVNDSNICHSEVVGMHIGEERYSLSDLVSQELYFQEAKKNGGYAMPTSLDVEKHITLYKNAYAISDLKDDAFENFLYEKGLSYKKFKHEITKNLAISNYISSFVQGHVFVTEQEVRAYYNEHPEYTEEEYLLKTAVVPFDRITKKSKKIPRPNADDWVHFDEWIKKSDIAPQMHSIFSVKKGHVCSPIKIDVGYQYVWVVDKREARLKTFDEQYVTIQKKLHTEKMHHFESDLKDSLLKKATILYF